MVKGPDIYVLAGLLAEDGEWSYRSLAERLHVPHASVQRALRRAEGAGLYSGERREVHIPHFEEFAIHALRFVAPTRLGPLCPGGCRRRGRRSRWPVPIRSSEEPPPVWPYARAKVRGQAIEPLHPAAPEAVEDWAELGESLGASSTACGPGTRESVGSRSGSS